jgi:hypothetical protein
LEVFPSSQLVSRPVFLLVCQLVSPDQLKIDFRSCVNIQIYISYMKKRERKKHELNVSQINKQQIIKYFEALNFDEKHNF